jgi:hypothetical protein
MGWWRYIKNGESVFDSGPVITADGDTAKSLFLLFNMMEANEQMPGVQQGVSDQGFASGLLPTASPEM